MGYDKNWSPEDEEQVGIIGRHNGYVDVAYHCARCEIYWGMTLPQDDYSEDMLHSQKCYACSLRDRLALRIRYSRNLERANKIITQKLEAEVEIYKDYKKKTGNLLKNKSQIIHQQNIIIKDLKNTFEKSGEKKSAGKNKTLDN